MLNEGIEKKVHDLLIEKKLTLSFAESCTGGALSSILTKIPDASLYFLGSIVAYSNNAKKELLLVKNSTLEEKGAVSEETAREMAEGAQIKFHSDISLATTGIAGPNGATARNPVGTVCFSLKTTFEIFSWTKHFQAEREKVIELSILEALQSLYRQINS